MRQVLHVLLMAVSRFLQGCADFFARLGERSWFGAEAPDPAALLPRSTQPPEDWLRRASPPPPAHWLRTVRARAPGFLRERGFSPVKPGLPVELPLPPTNVSAAPAPGPEADAPERKPSVRTASLYLPARSPREGVVRRPTPPRPVRIVTVVEETPRRKPQDVRPPEAAAEATERLLPRTPDSRDPEIPREALPAPLPEMRTRKMPSPEAPTTPPGFAFEAVEENAWTPLLHPALASVAVPEVPGSGALPALESPEGAVRPAAPEHPDFRSSREPSESRERSAAPSPSPGRWPELPSAELSDDLEDARLLFRELRRQAELECEQRGMPWSA